MSNYAAHREAISDALREMGYSTFMFSLASVMRESTTWTKEEGLASSIWGMSDRFLAQHYTWNGRDQW